jgi:hypothetical protein
MTVVSKVPALELELDPHALPLAGAYLALRFAIGEFGLNRLDRIAEFDSQHAEEKNDALLVDRFVAQASEVDRVPVCRALVEFRILRTN